MSEETSVATTRLWGFMEAMLGLFVIVASAGATAATTGAVLALAMLYSTYVAYLVTIAIVAPDTPCGCSTSTSRVSYMKIMTTVLLAILSWLAFATLQEFGWSPARASYLVLSLATCAGVAMVVRALRISQIAFSELLRSGQTQPVDFGDESALGHD